MQRAIPFCITATLFLAVLVPSVSQAAYVFQGHVFQTRAEYNDYVAAYAETWRSLYGTSYTSTGTFPRTTRAHVNTQERTSNRVTVRGSEIDVSTDRVRDISAHGARVTGRITHHDADTATVWFLYGERQKPYASSTVQEVRDARDRSDMFDQNLAGLVHNTRYYVIAVAEDEYGNRTYGEWESFRTGVDPRIQEGAVRISTYRAQHVDEDRAVLRARIDLDEALYARVWFEYGDIEDGLEDRTRVTVVNDADVREVLQPVRNLDDERTYYYRVVAEDPTGARNYGRTYSFRTTRDIDDEMPEVGIDRAMNVTRHEATIVGTVDMNDFNNGTVFLLYGEDEDDMLHVRDREDEYDDIREYGDDLQKVRLDGDLDSFDRYEHTITGLDLDTRHYYAIGVSYEDDSDDDVLLLSRIRYFTTED